MSYRVTRPALLLNRPHTEVFRGNAIPRERGLFIALEGVALAGTTLHCLEEYESCLRVDSEIFGKGLYIDRRCVEKGLGERPILPPRDAILHRMESLLGVPYVWGGNAYPGLPEMLTWWPPSGPLSDSERIQWTAAGVDCSGLLYQATNGAVPRNTRDLVHWGRELPRKLSALEPLDMIVWPGHVVFVGSRGQALESRFSKGGVVESNLEERLAEILRERGDHVWFRRISSLQ